MGESPQVLGQAGLLIDAQKKGRKERKRERGREGRDEKGRESTICGCSGCAAVVERFPTHARLPILLTPVVASATTKK